MEPSKETKKPKLPSEYQLERMEDHFNQISRALRRMSESVELALPAIKLNPEATIASMIADVAWGVANLSLDAPVRAIGDYRKLLDAEREMNDE